MPREECSSSEDVVRAILRAHWDESKKRYSSDLFRGPNTSVSRLSILPLDALVQIFRKDFDATIRGPVAATGTIRIRRMQELGTAYEASPVAITVEANPTDDNPAHAEIPQKLSKGLSLLIIANLRTLPVEAE